MPKGHGLAEAFIRGIEETPSGFFKPVTLVFSTIMKLFEQLCVRLRG